MTANRIPNPVALEPSKRDFHYHTNEGDAMLLMIAAVLVVLWLLGLIASIGGGFIHLLLVVAVIMIVVHLLRGRSTV